MENQLSWREKTVIRILLLVARIVAGDEKLQREIEHVSNHITHTGN